MLFFKHFYKFTKNSNVEIGLKKKKKKKKDIKYGNMIDGKYSRQVECS